MARTRGMDVWVWMSIVLGAAAVLPSLISLIAALSAVAVNVFG